MTDWLPGCTSTNQVGRSSLHLIQGHVACISNLSLSEVYKFGVFGVEAQAFRY